MLTAMAVTDDCMLELKQRRNAKEKEETKTYDNYSCLDVYFRVVFNFVVFSILCADEV